ncbi:MAG: DR2241 family protein [Verrucomicrobiales bacterium]
MFVHPTSPHQFWPQAPFTVGEIRINPLGKGYRLSHRDPDFSRTGLHWYCNAEEARWIARTGVEGAFRPLKTAPTLRRDWVMELHTQQELRLALEFFYPGAMALWRAHQTSRLEPVSLLQHAARQTGMYRIVGLMEAPLAREVVAKTCSTGNCLRTILWSIEDGGPPVEAFMGGKKSNPAADLYRELRDEHSRDGKDTNASVGQHIPNFCREACPLLVGAARGAVKAERAKQEQAAAIASPTSQGGPSSSV